MSSDSEDSDYNYNTRKVKSSKRKKQPKKRATNPKISKSISDKKLFTCDACGFISVSKRGLCRHHDYCSGLPRVSRSSSSPISPSNLHCQWCDVKFNNRGNLTQHVRHVHGNRSFESTLGIQQMKSAEFKCPTCDKTFIHNFQLTYHVRRMHYNMISKIPYAMIKKVNQVWFEKVLNSNNIMEIKKTGQNKLLMKKLDENTSIKVNNDFNDVVDVSHLYPIGVPKRNTITEKCPMCEKLILRRDLSKHISELHHKKIKHQCNNCHRGFKRLYIFLKHVCGRTRLRGISMKEGETDIQISSVESLAIPL